MQYEIIWQYTFIPNWPINLILQFSEMSFSNTKRKKHLFKSNPCERWKNNSFSYALSSRTLQFTYKSDDSCIMSQHQLLCTKRTFNQSYCYMNHNDNNQHTLSPIVNTTITHTKVAALYHAHFFGYAWTNTFVDGNKTLRKLEQTSQMLMTTSLVTHALWFLDLSCIRHCALMYSTTHSPKLAGLIPIQACAWCFVCSCTLLTCVCYSVCILAPHQSIFSTNNLCPRPMWHYAFSHSSW